MEEVEVCNDDIYAVKNLHCTICMHDLNHPVYLCCTHPILSVPLCAICHDDIQKSDLFDDDVDVNDICTWCGEGGDVFMCSDEENCNRSFCRLCVTSNFPPEVLHCIENDDEWLCFCCDPRLLQPFIHAASIAEGISIYNKPFIPSQEGRRDTFDTTSDESPQPSQAPELTEAELEIQKNIYLLRAVIEGITEASKNLEGSVLKTKEAEIRTELRETNADPTVRFV